MKRNIIKSERRARIVLSRERDIERKLDEKERINLQLEEYMKQYAALTGENRVLSDATKKRGKTFWMKKILVFVYIIFFEIFSLGKKPTFLRKILEN